MRSSIFVAVLPVLASIAGSVACSAPSESDVAEISVARSSLSRDLAPNVSAEDRATFAGERADFSLDLLREVAKSTPGQNVVISPHSASVALAMTYAGAGAGTKAAMAKALRFTLPEATTNAAFNATDLALASRAHAAAAPEDGAVEISSANSVWSPTRELWDAGYLDTLAQSYGAGVNLVSFDPPEPAARAINGWVADQTRTRIPEILSEKDVRGASWVLVNALYLKANWAHRFEKEATFDAEFHTASGDVTVPTMIEETPLRAVHRDDYDAVELPYDGGDLAMVLFAPASGSFDKTVAALHGRDLLSLPLEEQLVRLRLPKFEVRTHGEMTDPLTTLGMPKRGAFPGGADEIAVIQEAWLAADEAGTEAAAATAVVGRVSSAPVDPPKPLEITIDRPFLYAVVDKPTGAILFVGETLDPSKK